LEFRADLRPLGSYSLFNYRVTANRQRAREALIESDATLSIPSGAKQAAEKGLFRGDKYEKHPAGASMRRLVVSSRFCFCFFIHGVFVFAFAFVVAVAFLPFSSDSSRASIRTRCEPIRARCLMGPDKDELGLLSKARPITVLPCVAVTRTRD
jgi:hypothetical protein